jgi:hypothetical protein
VKNDARPVKCTEIRNRRSEEETGIACKEKGNVSGISSVTKFENLLSKIVEAPAPLLFPNIFN